MGRRDAAGRRASSLSQRASSFGGGDRAAERLVAPGGRALAASGGEGQRERPGALLVAGGVPLDVAAVDTTVREPLGDPLGEGRPGRDPRLPTRALLGDAGDVLALGEDRPLEAADLLDGPARAVGDLLGGQAAPDEGLDLARAQPALDLDLELARAAGGRAGRRPAAASSRVRR